MSDSETTPDAPTRPCPTCGSAMAREQDWCLECGTAAPGRLSGLRPGWRAVGTTLALTLVLVGGAGAASYAALSSDANRESLAAVPADATPVAEAPPAVAAPAAPVEAPKLPKVTATTSAPPEVPAETPAVPETPAPATPTPTPTTPTTPAATPTTTGDDDAPTEPAADAPQPVELGADTVAVYDPYRRAAGAGDPADAYDGDAGTALSFRGPDDGDELQVGVVVDLESKRAVRELELRSRVPGARLEVYTTTSSTLPKDVLDTRWDHPASRRTLDATERIELFATPRKVRYVLLWFTAPPPGSAYVGVRELSLLA